MYIEYQTKNKSKIKTNKSKIKTISHFIIFNTKKLQFMFHVILIDEKDNKHKNVTKTNFILISHNILEIKNNTYSHRVING